MILFISCYTIYSETMLDLFYASVSKLKASNNNICYMVLLNKIGIFWGRYYGHHPNCYGHHPF